MKKIIGLMSLLLVTLTGCIKERTNDNVITFYTPFQYPALSILGLESKKVSSVMRNYTINYEIEQDASNVAAFIKSRRPEVAIVPSNLAAVLFNQNEGYQIMGTVSFGSFYLVSTSELSNADNIIVWGQNQTPDLLARTLYPTKTIRHELSPAAVLQKFMMDKTAYAILPEPQVSNLKNSTPGLNIQSLNDLYISQDSDNTIGYPQATLIGKTEFIEKNKAFITNLIGSEEPNVKSKITESIEYLLNPLNHVEIKEYLTEHTRYTINATLFELSYATSGLNFVRMDETSKGIYTRFYTKFASDDATKPFIGGKVPADEIYYLPGTKA